MIGVIAKHHQRGAVEAFFEFFKVPWEHYQRGRSYQVIVSTDPSIDPGRTPKLSLLFAAAKAGDEALAGPVLLRHAEHQYPVYGSVSAQRTGGKGLLSVGGTGAVAGSISERNGGRIIQIGYDLFDEVEHLLTKGQTVQYADIPTMEIHVDLLRQWILDAEIPLVEIPCRPQGADFITCLTHDVDFINLRDHGLDRSLLGFIKRAVFPRSLRDTRSRVSWSRLFKNWKALCTLPGVYLGYARDPWFDFDRYLAIEGDLGSTYFFIPFKGDAGHGGALPSGSARAAKYDIDDYQPLIDQLLTAGCEIGLHGIDAWQDAAKGDRESSVIQRRAGKGAVGVRMHWLFFSERTPALLEQTGFSYDSTLGFNEVAGFRNGTAQVFHLPGTHLPELPLHLMDTTLFYPDRMGLSEAEAFDRCKKLIDQFRSCGGACTINWHTRSLGPERNWDDFYLQLVSLLRSERVWFASASQAVEWFRERRSVRFEVVENSDQHIKVRMQASRKNETLPRIMVRCYRSKTSFSDTPWSGDHTIEHTLA